jgi:nitroimidazol reductase NimA-like FMN-containing flavoprotein (pyridoxamine 5'-phosphate oxidase superfamily)
VEDAVLEALDEEECLLALGAAVVARIAFVEDGRPSIVPVNHRLVDAGRETPVVLVRTRPGAHLDHVPRPVALEVDGHDDVRQVGWSVVVEGDLVRVDPPHGLAGASMDPRPWIEAGRDAWLALVPRTISGRRLLRPPYGWAFDPRGYL